jgi:hypothetical protein
VQIQAEGTAAPAAPPEAPRIDRAAALLL